MQWKFAGAEKTLVGHVLKKILRFCSFFTKHSDVLSAIVKETKFQINPLPQSGLVAPISLSLTLYCIMLENGQTYFKNFAVRCEHRKIFKVCLAIFQHYAIKG